jgi:hypothetical protein
MPPSGVQRVKPVPHVTLQLPFEQTVPLGQAAPQAPQLALSVWVSKQDEMAPPSDVHSVALPAQIARQMPTEQAWPLPHALLQAPQLSLSVPMSTQVITPFTAQRACPGAH